MNCCQWQFHAGGHSPPPQFRRTLDTLSSIDSQKNSKLDATRCQNLRQNAQNSISAEAPPQTLLGGAYSDPPDPLAVFNGPTSKRMEGRGEGREREEKG